MAINVLNFGAGVQSTTILLMSIDGILPRLDHVIFADTQWEPQAVYRHLEWCKEIAAKHGLEISVRTAGNLRADLIDFWGPKRASADGKRHASIPAFVKNPDGTSGMVRRQCTGTYKIDVIERFVREDVLGLKKRQRWPTQHVVTNWIGISADERRRMKVSVRPAIKFWHPLIEATELDCYASRHGLFGPAGMTRSDCLRWIADCGYPRPPRSACIGCPFRSDSEWKSLSPDEFDNACQVDSLIRIGNRDRVGDLRGEPYLHSQRVPLREVKFTQDDQGNWDDECSGICGV